MFSFRLYAPALPCLASIVAFASRVRPGLTLCRRQAAGGRRRDVYGAESYETKKTEKKGGSREGTTYTQSQVSTDKQTQ